MHIPSNTLPTVQVYNKSRQDLNEGEISWSSGGQSHWIHMYTTHGVPNRIQVYDESQLEPVKGVRELFVTLAGRGECLCKVISSTRPMCRCIMRAGWTWLREKHHSWSSQPHTDDLVEGVRELFIEKSGRGEYLCKVISSTHPMCMCIMRADWTWLRGEGSWSSGRLSQFSEATCWRGKGR